MKAVILNSGLGRRMGNLTVDKPKCLVNVDESETILSRQIKMLENAGIKDFLITTGPFEDKIINTLKKYKDINVEYVNNPDYANTNYIYSMLLAKEKIKEDILLLHGDLVFDKDVLFQIINSKNKNTVLIQKDNSNLPEKDFKAKIENNRIKKIGIDLMDKDCYFMIPFYKITKEFIIEWINEMENFGKLNILEVYAENALNKKLDKLELNPEYYENKLCMEIDDKNDLKIWGQKFGVRSSIVYKL
ncbi:MAG: NTP transferase domain-containing protein [Novosphingobium sp.]|nr:NTP transferase domain-containing protein [Novosphingobium sp.]